MRNRSDFLGYKNTTSRNSPIAHNTYTQNLEWQFFRLSSELNIEFSRIQHAPRGVVRKSSPESATRLSRIVPETKGKISISLCWTLLPRSDNTLLCAPTCTATEPGCFQVRAGETTEPSATHSHLSGHGSRVHARCPGGIITFQSKLLILYEYLSVSRVMQNRRHSQGLLTASEMWYFNY